MPVFVRKLFGIGKLPDDLRAEVEAEGVRLSLATADVTTRVHGPGGALTLDGLALEVRRA